MSSKFYPDFIPICGYMVSGLSAAADHRSAQFDRKRYPSMTNVELMNSFYFIFLKEQSEATSTIRHSSIVIRHSIKLSGFNSRVPPS
jgi:hypothetical protein